MLEALKLPVIATGPMQIDTRIKDVGKHRQLDLKAKLGDLEASVKGTLKTRSLIGSDLKFEATAADAARLASVFEVSGVPAAPLKVTGHTLRSRKEIKFESLTAAIADASVRANGSVQLKGERKIALNFEVAAASLAKLRETWPEMEVAASGDFESAKDRYRTEKSAGHPGQDSAGRFAAVGQAGNRSRRSCRRRAWTSRRSFRREKPSRSSRHATSAARSRVEAPKKKFVFSETPLALEKMKDTDAKVHLAFGELVLGDRSIKDLDSNLRADNGKLTFDLRAAGAHEGTMQGAGTLVPAGDGTVDLDMKVDISNVRASLASEGIPPADVPPLSMAMNIKIHGSSPRQLASGANGQLLLTQGAGRTKSGFISAYGGGVVSQLAQKLNPFAKEDPFMKLDCTIARADIVNGQVTVKPVLLQTEKVTMTATAPSICTPRSCCSTSIPARAKASASAPACSPIRSSGWKERWDPRMGVGAKGVASGALAAATGGVTVVAGGLIDRMAGEKDLCGRRWQQPETLRSKNMTSLRTSVVAVAAALLLQGCYTAPTTAAVPQTRPISERFEQSWQAARAAASDVGVRVTNEDRAAGTLRGEQGSSNVLITVITQADASIQVGFSVTGGGSPQDTNLKDHLTRAYQRRMGR